MDRKIPIACVATGEFGIGVAIDIEGNCRFYDFYRLRKLAKISAKASAKQHGGSFRLLPKPVFAATADAFLGLVQSEEVETVTMPEPPVFVQPDPKNPVPVPEPKPYVARAEKEIVIKNKYSDDRSKLASLTQII
jgi:hypothetical protein